MPGDEWYSYAVFRFTREQVLWALANMGASEWVAMPDEYITNEYDKESKKWIKVVKRKQVNADTPITKKQVKGGAPFEKPASIIGEINLRLRLTGVDGKLLVAEVRGGIERYEDLDYESKMALNFISGWRRRRNYSQFKADRRRHR